MTQPYTNLDLSGLQTQPISNSPQVVRWLKSRGISPSAVEALALASALVETDRQPAWAAYTERTWVDAKALLIVDLYNPDGERSSVIARRIGRGKGLKSSSPTGYRRSGLLMANAPARALLQGEALKVPVIITEGEADWLIWCQLQPSLAVFGVFNGSWLTDHGDRIPAACPVAIRVDHDGSGDKYATHIARTLSHCKVWRSEAREDDADDNDAWLTGGLDSDPFSDASRFEPEPEPQRQIFDGQTSGDVEPERAAAAAEAILSRVLSDLASAPKGGRNHALYKAAATCSMLRKCCNGPLDAGDLEETLVSAGVGIGQSREEARSTVRSAFERGRGDVFELREREKPARPKSRKKSSRKRKASKREALAAPQTAEQPAKGAASAESEAPACCLERVKDLVKGAPVASDLRMPEGYYVAGSAIVGEFEGRDGEPYAVHVAPRPVLIRGIVEDVSVTPPTHRVEIVWRERSRWVAGRFDRRDLASGRHLKELARYGVPVSDANVKPLIKYLDAFLAANEERLPRARSKPSMGWVREGIANAGFMLGDSLVTSGGEVIPSSADANQWSEEHILYAPPDDGEAQWARRFERSGSLDGWRQAVACLERFPRAAMALYSSLASPLLSLLPNRRSIFIEWASRNGRGKTICLQIAASLWGRCGERGGLVGTWQATQVAIERRAAMMAHLPLILNDTNARHERLSITGVVYNLSEGQTRGRGSINGMQASSTWNLVSLSSGEQRSTSFARDGDGGAHGRVMSVTGSPFGEYVPVTGLAIDEMMAALMQHHGCAGLEWVKALVSSDAARIEWLHSEHTQLTAKYRRIAQEIKSDQGARFAPDFAAIDLAARCAHKVLDLPWAYNGAVETVAREVLEQTTGTDVARVAAERVANWCALNRHRFWSASDSSSAAADPTGDPTQATPSQGWAGRWDRDSSEVLISAAVVDSLLDGSLTSRDVAGEWAARGLIRTPGGKRPRLQMRQRVSGASVRGYALNLDAVDALSDSPGET